MHGLPGEQNEQQEDDKDWAVWDEGTWSAGHGGARATVTSKPLTCLLHCHYSAKIEIKTKIFNRGKVLFSHLYDCALYGTNGQRQEVLFPFLNALDMEHAVIKQ